eukprot:TRINITY_DN9583_c0_g1_i1.p1 TRINITY_DN9583_c0_g1~~TRINITY_DN9583_c0_g1_i1.p1  ORF type:complete len:265 (+),score=95.08 TRINITY_DN9583_c0_g1_i1:1-795(+)
MKRKASVVSSLLNSTKRLHTEIPSSTDSLFDLNSILQCTENLEHIINDILHLAESNSSPAEIDGLARKGTINLLNMKENNRNVWNECERNRLELLESNRDVDAASLDLIGTAFQRDFLSKEIQMCKDSTSKSNELVIELISQEEMSESDVSNDQDEHQMTISRLSHELELRKKMRKSVDEIKMKRKEQQMLLDKRHPTLIDMSKQCQEIKKAVIGMATLTNVAAKELQKKKEVQIKMLQMQQDAVGKSQEGDKEQSAGDDEIAL